MRRRGAHPATRALATVGAGAIAFLAARTALNFFGPAIPYKMCPPNAGLDSVEFLRFLSLVTDGAVRHSKYTRLRNGEEFYPAELDAVSKAQRAINVEFYEFSPGEVADRLLAALEERARAGVEVCVLVDAMGSFHTPDSYFDRLRAAGGKMHWYHPAGWRTWPQINNRTHRKMIVIDGEVGFAGGAGIADHWLHETKAGPAWRDTVFRIDGAVVARLLSTFTENWLEASGAILSGAPQFGFREVDEGSTSFVVTSTPHGGGTQARILFQALINSARESLRITTPYFLPDRSARQALMDAARRGVCVEILTAGPKIDHPMVRRMSRHSSWRLLRAGARIWEYQPSMIHAKLMTVDHQWSVFGSANFDHRSFALNDEVNVAVRDPNLANVIEKDFDRDLRESRELTVAQLREQEIFALVADVADPALSRES